MVANMENLGTPFVYFAYMQICRKIRRNTHHKRISFS
ncbi:hypothetical protein T06_8580 [Trichinella sp. T6]|nr:hypothetical protein T06_8580 [Trichinella sp. T6]